MNLEIEDCYFQICDEVIVSVPDVVGTMVIYAEMDNGKLIGDMIYERAEGNSIAITPCPAQILELVSSLWLLWKSHPGNDPWFAITYLMSPERLEVKYTYPDMVVHGEKLSDRRTQIVQQHFANTKVSYTTH